jgi:serine/threonine protein kinase
MLATLPQSITHFQDDDRGFFGWLEHNPDGFFINSERNPKSTYLVLHSSNCPHFDRSPNIHWTKDYVKFCSPDRRELEEWVLGTVGAEARLCRTCFKPARRQATMGGVAEFEPGEVFAGRYEVQRLLGEGDRKRTFLARDMKMDRPVAISLVKPDAALSDPEGTEREAKVLGRIGEHDNIVSLYDYELGGGISAQYMVFEYLGGGTLTEYLQEAGQLSLDDILRLGRQLCRGLSHLHKRGLVHRDVSPDNVWLDERHVAHLGDFDSAITASGDSGDLRPITTGAFAAPEEREGRSLDARCDLFSLGGVLYVVATGEPRPGDLGLLRSQRPDLPSAFADLVASLLSESSDDRPQDAEEVLHRLGEIRQASDIEAFIAAGENNKVEFKSSLHHPYGPLPEDLQKKVDYKNMPPEQAKREVQKRLNIEVTKTIAAFLNTDGGTLLVGVDDSGTVLGIEPDFGYCQREKQNSDGWLSSLKQMVINALGAEVWSAVHVSLVPHEQKTVAVVRCPPRTGETWHHADGDCFYMRASNATEELTGPGLVRYIREHWPV